MYRHQSEELRARWDDETTAFILDSLQRGRPTSPHGTHEGRVDLRGIKFDQPEWVRVNDDFQQVTHMYEFERTEIRDVDLSFAVLPEWRVIKSVFDNCIFDNAKLPSFRAYSAIFNRCSFRSSGLKDAVMGAREKGPRPPPIRAGRRSPPWCSKD